MAGRLRTIRDLVALVVAVIMVGAVVVGIVGMDRPATAATTTTHRVTIPAAAFRPVSDGVGYFAPGMIAYGDGNFVAPVHFYRPGSKVRVLNMTLYFVDNAPVDICAILFAGTPGQFDGPLFGIRQLTDNKCSSGEAPGLSSFQVRTMKPRNVTEFQGVWVTAYFPPGSYGEGLMLIGARITYRVTE